MYTQSEVSITENGIWTKGTGQEFMPMQMAVCMRENLILDVFTVREF